MNAPTLIVGLGGKGSDIALRVSERVREELNEEQRKHIGFVVFDTDVNELKEIKEKNPFVATIQTSTKLSVGEYLNIDKHARDTWFPVNAILNSKTLTEGAGQVRSISRLAFETAIRAGKLEELHKAIEDLYKLEGDEYEQALRVIIVSSLAGGTGSGLILPVGLYIKNYLATHFRQSANITRGFFLLPEVFYGVIPGQTERNNLKSNAYATLRELDAFLMKGDNTLHPKYQKTVAYHFPTVASGEYEEYNVRPYDFCFLFDAQNADGKKLNSFNQYLDHAANCIYAQSIGPMNKRSNSSEDNTIRKLAAEKGRNRYAGAGTSMLIYPVEDVKKYMSLNWAKQCVSDQWMVYDKMYERQCRENDQKRRDGIRVPDISPEKSYTESVENMANNKDSFSRAIIEACSQKDADGFATKTRNWEIYVEALKAKIEKDYSEGNEDLDGERNTVNSLIYDIDGSENKKGSEDEMWTPYVNAYNGLKTYQKKVERFIEESASSIAYTIFKSPNDSITSDKFDYQIETYMRDTEGQFIHPNAARYFLYKALDRLRKEYNLVNIICDEHKSYFDNFEKNNFDDAETDDVIETVEDLAKTKKVSASDKIKHRLSADQEDLKDAYRDFLSHIDQYRTAAVYKEVLKEGMEYIKNLSQSFQVFFSSFKDKVGSMDTEIRQLETKREAVKGTAARYVCASEKCLKKMFEEHPYTGKVISIDGKLAERIYLNVREYAMTSVGEDNPDFFKNLFNVGILGYYSDLVMEQHREDIDMDILTAIEREAIYEHGKKKSEDIQQYVKHVIAETKVLSAPFIEKPLGEETQPIPACTYAKSLNPKDGSARETLIEEELGQFGGKADEDIPKNLIMFYKSFYGLRATDLSKFAPPEESLTYSRPAGEYYKAYYELVSSIYPDTNVSRTITPHIDRWWHNASKMPDLDDANQERQEKEIYSAFFWSLLSNYIDLYDTEDNTKKYRLSKEKLNLEDISSVLMVSNMTPCDRLYEVLDSLEIFPVLVDKINEKVDAVIAREVEKNISITDSELYYKLENFVIKEFPLGEKNKSRSIFDLPLLMRKSVPAEMFYEEDAIAIFKAEIDEIKRFAAELCPAKEAVKEAGKIIIKQFKKFLDDIQEEIDEWKNIYQEELFSRICGTVVNSLEEMGLENEASEVGKVCDALCRGRK